MKKKLICPYCNGELEEWVTKGELPLVEKNCKILHELCSK